MTLQIHKENLPTRKLFFIILTFTIVVCLCPLLTKSSYALDFNNINKQSKNFHEVPLNSTNKVTMIPILTNWIGDKISRAVHDLEVSSREQTLKNISFLDNVSSEFNGIPFNLDLDKRNLAKDILQQNKDITSIFFVLPNGDIYLGEPYSNQEQLPRLNFADREWYKGVIKNNQTYISSIFMSASINAPAIAIAVPVYSLNSDSNSQTVSSHLSGYWVGIVDLKSLKNFFESLSLDNQNQFLLIDYNGTEFFDTKKSNIGSVYNSLLENQTSGDFSGKLTNQNKLETFDHFDLVKTKGNETRAAYYKISLTDQMVMYWKSFKIKDSNWYLVLITRNDS